MVILVNEKDEEIGTMPKLQAHKAGLLHRAFSVFIFNTEGKLLLQQRALTKYHTPGLWTNSCCSHPLPSETVKNAALRRLEYEMGINNVKLMFLFKFIYKVDFENGLAEHEIDHVFVGYTDQQPTINNEEANSYAYVYLDDIRHAISRNPDNYTPWFKIIMDKHFDQLSKHAKQ
ncbi:MAG: isopentenyl-diphosphate Delta-isomerase [Bacteroidota bacterium]|jgi:isopentenyl-diphosphate delta-isomerase